MPDTNFKNLTRQMDFLNPEQMSKIENISVFGVGGIGSPTALLLAKMGFPKIELIDKDIVEDVNVGSQLYGEKDLRDYKVNALKTNINLLTTDDCEISTTTIDIYELELWKNYFDDVKTNILILALDSNDLRMYIYEKLIEHGDKLANTFIIDARMGGVDFSIDAGHWFDLASTYHDFLKSDNEIPDGPCTGRAICYNTFCISSMIAAICRKITLGMPLPRMRACMEEFLFFDYNKIHKQ